MAGRLNCSCRLGCIIISLVVAATPHEDTARCCYRDAVTLQRTQAAFGFSYVLAQYAGGWAGARWGNKRVHVFAMLGCIVGHWATPVMAATSQHGPSASAIGILCYAMGLCTGSQHATLVTIVDRWCLPSERRWVNAMDGVVSVACCLLNCLVIARLMIVLEWRATMLLLSGVLAVALVGVKFFVADGPVAGAGRLRLSDGEAALFRAEGMLFDECSPAMPKADGSGVGGAVRLVTTTVAWLLIALEMSVAWDDQIDFV
eukprot:COSAG02_NODE_1966_length_10235_cov_3.563635_2_plen_259_part_00